MVFLYQMSNYQLLKKTMLYGVSHSAQNMNKDVLHIISSLNTSTVNG